MSALVCALATYKVAGFGGAFLHVWLGGWLFAWPAAFAVLATLGPAIRRSVYRGCQCPLEVPNSAGRSASEPRPNSSPDLHLR
ncbi:DUF2798 domain-containing protein [Litoreibacter roseus]|uniref:DUF2798 domain-containing protein n=1 Tax=Litoreibacter roseus TaxID=2601869 RepID=UPI003570E8BA